MKSTKVFRPNFVFLERNLRKNGEKLNTPNGRNFFQWKDLFKLKIDRALEIILAINAGGTLKVWSHRLTLNRKFISDVGLSNHLYELVKKNQAWILKLFLFIFLYFKHKQTE